MRWSWKLVEIAGIDVKVHATFVLILLWVGYLHWRAGESAAAIAAGLLFVLLLFGCVVLHELGHALTARRFGIRTRDIILLPIGGVARLERVPEDPRQELWVAAAGPAVNVAIAGALFLWLQLSHSWQPLERLTVAGGSLAERLMVVNVFLVVFNLIPAFPMDGGRVLRALLAMRMDYTRATQLAASIGQGLALVFGFVGLFSNPFLVFIALFVWIGAAQEAGLAQMKGALGGIPVGRVMMTDFRTLVPEDPLSRAVELTLATPQRDFPVLEGERLVGIVTQRELFRGLHELGPTHPVAELMLRDFQVAELSEMMEPVFLRLQDCGCKTLPVLARGQLVGLLTTENLGEFLQIQSALRR